jgi:hypothetical protein
MPFIVLQKTETEVRRLLLRTQEDLDAVSCSIDRNDSRNQKATSLQE